MQIILYFCQHLHRNCYLIINEFMQTKYNVLLQYESNAISWNLFKYTSIHKYETNVKSVVSIIMKWHYFYVLLSDLDQV